MDKFTVALSPALIEQLVNGDKKPEKKPKRAKPKIARKPQSPLPSKVKKDEQVSHPSMLQTVTPPWGPVHLPVNKPPPKSENAELEAIKSTIQESEKVLDKLKKLEETMAHEVTQRAKDLREKEFKLPYQKPIPCLTEIDACKDCYKENVKNPRKCSPLAKSFVDCLSRIRHQETSTDK